MINDTFLVIARRCKRCGGILISSDAVKDGYGHTCKMKQREEERRREEERKTQFSFDDYLLDDTEFNESEGIDGDFIDDI